ncbi:MAG: long-chain fatty acid--CoA ligase [Proteobacteria bacterium]|nr:long-chain fatty acid--CoA ligase [Pseudomonadota bacterium]
MKTENKYTDSGSSAYDPSRSVGHLFFHAAEQFGDRVAMRRRDPIQLDWVDIDWLEFRRSVEALGAAIASLGIDRGERVAILSNSRTEWAIADLANFSIGAVTVPIYQSNLPDEVHYVLEHAEARVVFVEDREQLGKVLEVRGDLPNLKHAVLIDGKVKTAGFILSLEKLIEQGEQILEKDPLTVQKRLQSVSKEDMATIVYTSGTTGRPKGAVLTHANLIFELEALEKRVLVHENDETLLFLPLAHIFARVGFLLSLKVGYTISYAESIDRLLDNVAEIKPTFLFSVPRIYEKIYNKIASQAQRGNRLKRQIFAFSMAVGKRTSQKKQRGKLVLPHLSLSFQVAELLVFNKLKRLFGGKLRFCISGGAPLASEIAEFFHAAGILILEGYGLTENVAAAALNDTGAFKFGTVGKLLPGIQVRFEDDGEILFSGGNVFKEYFKRDKETSEAIVDGWFHTGDIGELDKDGFLKITDRKKELIVTSAGKNIPPQNIEKLMKTSPIMSQFMVYGDKRNYLTALVTLDQEEVISFAEHKEIEFEDFAELCKHPAVKKKVGQEIEKRNAKLASYETIKKFAIIEKDFEIGEELTPTLKIKRKLTEKKYFDILDGMYR